MKFCVIIINDGRNDYLERSLKSFSYNVVFPEGSEVYKVMIDDWPDGRNEKELKEIQAEYKIDFIILNEKNLGVNETVRKIWKLIPDDVDYIYHQENDFEYTEKIFISDLIEIASLPNIVQCALIRQPWFEDEVEAGSLMNTRPERFKDANVSGRDIILQRDHFTFNPSLYKKKWTTGEVLELKNFGEYAIRDYYINKNGGLWFAYYGKKLDANRVLHIGERVNR